MIWVKKRFLHGAIASSMANLTITKAQFEDLPEILQLQKLAYLSEAELVGNYNIEPLMQTLEDLQKDFAKGIVLKALGEDGKIVASIRAFLDGKTVYVGKLMVKPEKQNQGLGGRLLLAVEEFYPNKRYELFTSNKSAKNIYLYEKNGYKIFKRKEINADLQLVFLAK